MKLILKSTLWFPRWIRRASFCFGLSFAALVSACTYGTVPGNASARDAEHTLPASASRTGQPASDPRLIPDSISGLSSPPKNSKPYRLLAPYSTNSRIVNLDGKEVRRPEVGEVFGELTISPNRKWALLSLGDARYSIASMGDLHDIARPPAQPEGFDDATGFSWFILDDDHLLGQADLPSPPEEGLTMSENDMAPPREVLIYTFRISDQTLQRVQVDSNLPRIFVVDSAFDGHISLIDYSNDARVGAKIEGL